VLLVKLYNGRPAAEYPINEPLAPLFVVDVRPKVAVKKRDTVPYSRQSV